MPSAYLILLEIFVEGRITTDEFEGLYLFAFKNDREFHGEQIYEVLNVLFGQVDAYCGDESLFSPGDVSPDALRAAGERALGSLRNLERSGA
ncbi:colicin immunity domain-containing protein [Streptomyces sp. NPDC057137]|uniref:colicin immunity domain-containing protein n=1 Tax=Streptomyces sp. NPDC057137 TaxID=3346030 RepID=UPI00363933AF